MTDVQLGVLGALVHHPRSTSRQIARLVWPDDPGWRRRTAGRGASNHNGAMGATLPLRAGRVLGALERDGFARCEFTSTGPRAGYWTATLAGRETFRALR